LKADQAKLETVQRILHEVREGERTAGRPDAERSKDVPPAFKGPQDAEIRGADAQPGGGHGKDDGRDAQAPKPSDKIQHLHLTAGKNDLDTVSCEVDKDKATPQRTPDGFYVKNICPDGKKTVERDLYDLDGKSIIGITKWNPDGTLEHFNYGSVLNPGKTLTSYQKVEADGKQFKMTNYKRDGKTPDYSWEYTTEGGWRHTDYHQGKPGKPQKD